LPRLTRAAAPDGERAPSIGIVIPARDEAENIGRCLRSLLAQAYPRERLTILVVDDHSSDETAAIVRRLAAVHPHLALLRCPPLPPRWTGKAHACWNGANAAAGSAWLCFLDADVWGKPDLLARAVAAAQERHLGLLSLAPRQVLRSFAERLILPCGLVLISFLKDLRDLQAPDGADVTATGQFMLIRADAYQDAGGHAAVSGAICEDLELARRVKQSGRRVLLMNGEDVLTTRMYGGWDSLWPGLAKNLVDTLGGIRRTLMLVPAILVLPWAAVALPLIAAAERGAGAAGAGAALLMALAGSAAAFALHVAAAVYFRIPFYYGLIFPVGYTVGAAMALDSVWRRLTGRVIWKGRTYS
jgi:chlorobactene glucosyltransferase